MTNLRGTWRLLADAIEATIVFVDDAVLLGHRRYRWTDDGDCLLILPGEAAIVIPYRCEGDTLTIDVDGVVSVWSREGKSA